MPVQKVRMEVYDEAGNKYVISIQGSITRDKTIRLLDLVELLGGTSEISRKSAWNLHREKLTKFEKVSVMIDKHFPLVWFSSRDVQTAYEEDFKEPIYLSTISTYLSRMTDRGILIKDASNSRLRYRVIAEMINRLRIS